MEYENFEIEVGEGVGREYEVSVRSGAGEAREIMRFPYDKLALDNRLKDLQIALLRSGGKRRLLASPQEQAVKSFGQDLFNALISNEVRVRYDVSRERAAREDKGLRLILRIQEPEMAALPWEFMYDPRTSKYICLSRDTPIVRYPESPQPVQPLLVKPPLHILGMAVSPNDLNPLDVDREKQRLEQAITRLSGLVTITWLEGQTWQDLQEAMQRGPWHIFHFIGHGGFNERNDEGLLALADESGRAFDVSATSLARLLEHRQLKLVVLNSCEGARGGSVDIFSSTASILVRSGIPAVLAMQYEITDTAAIEFSRSFYRAVAQGLPLEAAVVEARISISIAVNNSVEWATPVLYLRSTDGRLFSIDLHKEQVDALYREAGAAMAAHDWSSAIEKINAVLEQDPSHEGARRDRQKIEKHQELLRLYSEGLEHYTAHRMREAEQILTRVIAIKSDFRDVPELLQQIQTNINAEKAAALYAQAKKESDDENWETALEILETIALLTPFDKTLLHELSRVRELKEVTELFEKGKELYSSGEWNRAVKCFEQLQLRAGEYKDSQRRIKIARLRCRAEETISQEKWSQALSLLEETLDLDPSDAELQAKLINVRKQEEIRKRAEERRRENHGPPARPPQARHPTALVVGRFTKFKTFAGQQIRQLSSPSRWLLLGSLVAIVLAIIFILVKLDLVKTEIKHPEAEGTKKTDSAVLVPPDGMVLVREGTYLMGRNGDPRHYESPAHQVTVPAFFIDIFEVTNAEYQKFVISSGYPAPTTWANGNYPAGADKFPVTGVKWEDATAYAKWVEKRLPTEEEWEFAARGKDGRTYPWGNEWQGGLANADGANRGLVAVGSYKKGASEVGALDMVGNAWEWTSNDLKAYPGGTLPSDFKPHGDEKVIRGGSWDSTAKQSTTTYRRGWGAKSEKQYDNTGFRCAKNLTN